MVEPPRHIAARRAQQRAERRRRRGIAGLAGLLIVLAAAGLVLAAVAGGGGGRSARASITPRRAAGRGRRVGPAAANQDAGHNGRLAAIEAAGNATIRRLAHLGLPVYCAGPHGNAVAFTFDDGPGPYTDLVLRKLGQARQRATFFVVGRSMDNYPGWLPRELRVAAIGDHTYTHPLLSVLAESEITSQLERTKQKIEAASGQPVDLFRPPFGGRNAMVDAVAKRLGMLEIVWNVDSADSLAANYAGIIKNVEAGLQPGSIILMHENRGQTIRALTTLLPELHRRHIRSVSLPELFAEDPPSVAQLRAGRAGCSLHLFAGGGG